MKLLVRMINLPRMTISRKVGAISADPHSLRADKFIHRDNTRYKFNNVVLPLFTQEYTSLESPQWRLFGKTLLSVNRLLDSKVWCSLAQSDDTVVVEVQNGRSQSLTNRAITIFHDPHSRTNIYNPLTILLTVSGRVMLAIIILSLVSNSYA